MPEPTAKDAKSAMLFGRLFRWKRVDTKWKGVGSDQPTHLLSATYPQGLLVLRPARGFMYASRSVPITKCAILLPTHNNNGSVNSKRDHPPPGICLFLKIMLQMPHGGVSSYVQIPTVGLLEECKRPTPGTRSF